MDYCSSHGSLSGRQIASFVRLSVSNPCLTRPYSRLSAFTCGFTALPKGRKERKKQIQERQICVNRRNLQILVASSGKRKKAGLFA